MHIMHIIQKDKENIQSIALITIFNEQDKPLIRFHFFSYIRKNMNLPKNPQSNYKYQKPKSVRIDPALTLQAENTSTNVCANSSQCVKF